jgi:hypothetical protein
VISAIGNIVINKLSDLPFVDKYAGAVRVASYAVKDGNQTLTKKFPVDCKTTETECQNKSRYFDLCPDSKKRSVMYLEDTGIRPGEKKGNYQHFTASYDLVCWLNMPLLGFSDCSYSGIAIAGILQRIGSGPAFNSPPYQLIDIQFAGQKSKMNNPFLKYSYDETVNQFLLYPYDYFVLALQVNFRIDLRCITAAQLNPPIDCINK